jgi:hypothetical protein
VARRQASRGARAIVAAIATSGCRAAFDGVSHPSAARLKAYANYETDLDRQVELHLGECGHCTDFVVIEMLRSPPRLDGRIVPKPPPAAARGSAPIARLRLVPQG